MRTRMPRGRSGRTALGGVLAAVSLALLWVAGMAPSGRLGLAALALLAAAPRLQKRYGPQWLCRLWVALAVLLLVPLHALVPRAPAAVFVDTTPLYSKTALSQEVTERPADGVPYMAATTGYIVPRAELQTGHRTVLERLAVGATRLNLLALAWNLGVLAVALYQFGGYAVWRIRVSRTAQPVDTSWRSALPQGACPRMVATPLVRSPMVAGTLHPVLLTPTGTAPNGADYMLAHELTHIKRRVPCIGITLLSGCWPPARAATLRRPVTPRPCVAAMPTAARPTPTPC